MKLTDSMQAKKLKCNYRPWRATIRATGVSVSDSSWACWLNTKTRRTKSSGSLVSLQKSGEIQNCVVADNKIQDRQGIWQASFLGGSAIRLPMLFTNRRWTKFIRKEQKCWITRGDWRHRHLHRQRRRKTPEKRCALNMPLACKKNNVSTNYTLRD